MKILIIEPECREWGHEQINSEFLSLISKANATSQIVFCAECGHLNNICQRNQSLTNVTYQEIDLPLVSNDTIKYSNKYYILFDELIKKGNYSYVFLFSTHKGNLIAIDKIASKYTDISFNLVLHGVVNQLSERFSLRQRLFDGKLFHGWGLRYLLNKTSKKKNIKYIEFGPTMKDNLKGVLPESTLSRIMFMHLPYKYDSEIHENRTSAVNIWVMGRCINRKAEEIIAKVEQKISADLLFFTVAKSSDVFSNNHKNVIFINKSPLTREQIAQEIQSVDYILIPYDKDVYRLTSSGILFDAINYEKPILALNSPLLKWYNNKYHIAICGDGCDELVDKIMKLIAGDNTQDYGNLKENIRNCKKSIIKENEKYVRELFN